MMERDTAPGATAVRTSIRRDSQRDVDVAVLLSRCLAGNERAWTDLIARYRRIMFRHAYQLSGNADIAEDVTSEVVLRLFQKLHTHREGTPFVPWLKTIVRNVYVDQYVRRIRARETSLAAFEAVDDTSHEMDIVDIADGPQQLVEMREASQVLADEMRSLPPSYRNAMQMYYAEDRSYIDIADTLSVSIGTVKSRLNRGRASLRRQLQKHDGLFPTPH